MAAASIIPFEKRLDSNLNWAMTEASLFFQGKGAVRDALRDTTNHLDELRIPYCIVGGLALFHHGYRHFTENIDVLVSREKFKLIHQTFPTFGYVTSSDQSKVFRDPIFGVKIQFLIAGEFPGDEMPKSIAFPNPATARCEAGGIRYLNLNTLTELKLASGMTNLSRMKDLADIVELIKAIKLPKEFASTLNPYVRNKFLELWTDLASNSPNPNEE